MLLQSLALLSILALPPLAGANFTDRAGDNPATLMLNPYPITGPLVPRSLTGFLQRTRASACGSLFQEFSVDANLLDFMDQSPVAAQFLSSQQGKSFMELAIVDPSAQRMVPREKMEEFLGTDRFGRSIYWKLNKYTGSKSSAINEYLRGLNLISAMALWRIPMIRGVRQALNKLPFYEGIVFRHAEVPESWVDKNLKIGSVYTDNGFMSTSREYNRDFHGSGARVLFIIRSRTGRAVHGHPYETEVLFLNGTSFRVINVIPHTQFNRQVYQVYMEEIEQRPHG